MWPFVSHAPTRIGALPTSIASTRDYIKHHLRSAHEAGDLSQVVGYLGRDGGVIPRFHNPAIWRLVGLTEEELRAGIVPDDLLANLLKGKDRLGRSLGRRTKGGFHRPHEMLITIPCEVSQALSQRGSGYGLQLLEAMSEEALRQVEEACTRVSRGGRKNNKIEWNPGEALALIFTHGTERSSSPGLPHHHAHVLIFGQVRAVDKTWRGLRHPRPLRAAPTARRAGRPRRGDA